MRADHSIITPAKLLRWIQIIEQAVDKLRYPSTNANGGPLCAGGVYWRLVDVAADLDNHLAQVEGDEHASFLRATHGVITKTPAFDLVAHLLRQREFSERTFGPGARTKGVIDHIRKELAEIEAAPDDVEEWVDVIILAFDGAWRAGWEPEAIIQAIVAKQLKNESRKWPDWRTAAPDKAIEHDRSADVVSCDTCRYQEFDLDGFYCRHPKSLDQTSFGLSTNAMSLSGLCVRNYDDKTKNTAALWEARKAQPIEDSAK